MIKFLATAAFGLTFGLGASAASAAESSATLTGIEGKGGVSVNQGEGFAPAVEGMRLSPGDRVMVQNDSTAELQFDDECATAIEENKIFTIPDRSTCAGGVPVVQNLVPTGSQAIGAAGAGVGPGNVAGGLIVAGWAAVGLWWLGEDDDDTVSP